MSAIGQRTGARPSLQRRWRAGTIVRLVLLLVLLGLTALGGGTSRVDAPSLLVLQPAAAALLALGLAWDPAVVRTVPRGPAVLLAALVVIVAVQLVPLPPSLWTALPGRAPLAEVAGLAGFAQPWRPLSMSPDLTLATLAGLTIPAAALLLFDPADARVSRVVVLALLAGVLLSALLGAAQVAGGPESPLYFYGVSTRGSAVGLLANRNHQAALIALAFPLVATLIATERERLPAPWAGAVLLGVAAVLLLPLVVLTGSRAGIGLSIVGLGCAAALLPREMRAAVLRPMRRWWPAVLAAAVAAIAVAAWLIARTEAGQRLLATDVAGEVRLSRLPRLLQIAHDHWPAGTGFGVFDPIYRSYETLDTLTPRYLNHAHSDPVELLITGGLPAMLLLGVALCWIAVRAARAFQDPQANPLARLGAAMAVLLLLASLVDYPLRTPLLGVIFTLALGWLALAMPLYGAGHRE